MNPWVGIVGREHEGRTAVALRVSCALARLGVRVGGFVELPIADRERLLGWDAIRVDGGAQCALARASDEPDLCTWRFDAESLERCRGWATAADLDVAVIEAGSLEARGSGHSATIRAALAGPPRVVLLNVRPRALSSIALALPDPQAALELPVDDEGVARFVEEVRLLATSIRGGP